MIFSRHSLDKVGKDLIGDDPFKRKDALAKIQKWRDTHLYVLRKLNDQLVELFSERNVVYAFSSMRLKRMTSIESKLKNNASAGLGGLQDIGGVRYVFTSIEELDEVKGILDDFIPVSFERKRIYDYVASPKESGYRSIHYVYKYHCDDSTYDDISIELQIRTRLQHAWAMAVETASLIANTTLKADINDGKEWRSFFKLASALFAKSENKPVHPNYASFTQEQLCKEYSVYEEKRLVEQLKALRVTVNIDLDKDTNGLCVLTIDFVSHIVHARVYTNAQDATKDFGDIEKSLNENEAALMVAIDKIKEIKEAYPSYFLDSRVFLKHMEEFGENCKLIL